MKPVRPWLVEPCRWQADLQGGANAGCHPTWAVAAAVHLCPLEAVCLQHLRNINDRRSAKRDYKVAKASCCTRQGNTITVTSASSVEGPAGIAHLTCEYKTTYLHGLRSWLRLGPRPALHPRQGGADVVHKLQRLMDSQARHAYRRRLRYSCHLLLLCLDQVVDQQVCKVQAARRAGVHLRRMMMSGCKLCHFAASSAAMSHL